MAIHVFLSSDGNLEGSSAYFKITGLSIHSRAPRIAAPRRASQKQAVIFVSDRRFCPLEPLPVNSVLCGLFGFYRSASTTTGLLASCFPYMSSLSEVETMIAGMWT